MNEKDFLRFQERGKRVINKAITSGRVSHAYLIYGMEGIGKKAMGLYISSALNCNSFKELSSPCLSCNSCRKIWEGTHPDTISIVPLKNIIRIDTIRDIHNKLKTHPYEANFRVILINQAEKMTQEAANALLKSLEEPIGSNVFVLTTREPEELLPTIVSRCQKLSLSPLPEEAIKEYLSEMEPSVTKELLDVVSTISGGSLRIARDLVSIDMALFRNTLLFPLLKKSPLKEKDRLKMAFFLDAVPEKVPAYLQLIEKAVLEVLELNRGYSPIHSLLHFLSISPPLLSANIAIALLEWCNKIEKSIYQLQGPINRLMCLEWLFLNYPLNKT